MPPPLTNRRRERVFASTAIACAVLVVIESAATAQRALSQAHEARAWVDHTYQVLAAIADVRQGMVTTVADTRGFILTQDERFTSDLAAAPTAEERAIAELRRLTVDMPPQQERIARLAPLVGERFAICADQVAAVRSGDVGGATAVIERGTALDRDIDRLLDDLRGQEQALLARRDEVSASSARHTSRFLALSCAAAVLVGLGAGPLVLHQMRRREHAEDALRGANADLERQVQARTSDLAESRERLALAQSVAGIGAWDWRTDDERVIWSPELEAMFGLPPGDYSGHYDDFRPFVLPEDLPGMEAAMRAALADGTRFASEFRIRRRDGEVRWHRAIGRVVTPGRFIGVNIDITQARRATDALVASERRYRFLAESMPQIVWTATPDGRLDYINDVLAGYIGCSVAAALGTSWTEIVHPEDVDATVGRWTRAVATGEDYAVELRMRRHDGVWRWFLVRARCLRGADGTILQWCGTSTDINEQKERAVELERMVRARTRELRQANEDLESFSYSVSHDLRAPLRAIEGFGDALAEDHGPRLEASALDHLARIRAAARRMGEIIDALLGLSRLGRSRLALERVDVAAIARAVLEDLARREPDRRVAWHVADCIARGDPALVRTALENLLANAWKFTSESERPRIDVTCAAAAPGMVAVRVADNGVGFDPLVAGKLFHPFKRFHDPARFPGTGIGLATVRRIVERHGGAITGDGRPGGGAAFTFTLPAAAPAAAELEAAEAR